MHDYDSLFDQKPGDGSSDKSFAMLLSRSFGLSASQSQMFTMLWICEDYAAPTPFLASTCTLMVCTDPHRDMMTSFLVLLKSYSMPEVALAASLLPVILITQQEALTILEQKQLCRQNG